MSSRDATPTRRRAPRWTAAEDRALRAMYGEGRSLDEIGGQLGRSAHAVGYRRRQLSIAPRRAGRHEWLSGQDAFIVAASRAGVAIAEVASRLGMPASTVGDRRAELLGGRRRGARRYTPDDDSAIRDAVNRGEALASIAAALDRSPGAIRIRARALGVVDSSLPRWSPQEDATLRAGYQEGRSCTAIATELAGSRTPAAVSTRARQLGLADFGRQWCSDEDVRLRAMAARGATVAQAAEAIVRSSEAIRIRAAHLQIWLADHAAPRRRIPSTPEEDELLRSWPTLDASRLGVLIGRSDRAVAMRRRRLGLTGGHSAHRQHAGPDRWRPAELRVIANYRDQSSERMLAVLARRLGRSIHEIQHVLQPAAAPATA